MIGFFIGLIVGAALIFLATKYEIEGKIAQEVELERQRLENAQRQVDKLVAEWIAKHTEIDKIKSESIFVYNQLKKELDAKSDFESQC